MTPSCSPRRASSEHVRLNRSISKSDLRSVQVNVRSWSKYANMHIFRSGLTSLVVWHHLRVSISILSRVIGEKLIVNSYDLRMTFPWPSAMSCTRIITDGGEWSWSWKNLVVSVSLCETGRIFIFPHRLIGEVTQLNWHWVPKVKILRHTFYRYRWPHAVV